MNTSKSTVIDQPYSPFLFILYIYRIGLRFNKNSRNSFIIGAVYLALTNLLKTATFFLPIKLLIIIPQETKPKYLNYISEIVHLDSPTLILMSMIPVIYSAYIVFGISQRKMIDCDFTRQSIIYKSSKTVSLNSNRFKNIHYDIVRFWSDTLLITTCLIMISLYDPTFSILILLIALLVFIYIFRKVYFRSKTVRFTYFNIDRSLYIEFLITIGFMVSFCAISFQLLQLNYGIIGAIYLIMLSRITLQAIQRLSNRGAALCTLLEDICNNINLKDKNIN